MKYAFLLLKQLLNVYSLLKGLGFSEGPSLRVLFNGAHYTLALEPGDAMERDGKKLRVGHPWGISKTVAPHELSTLAKAVDVDTGQSGPEAA